MFGRKSKKQNFTFDPATQKAVLHCSICTGEQVAGFRDLATGKFTDVALVKNDTELATFMEQYGVKNITKEY